jgi:hypothetical protein
MVSPSRSTIEGRLPPATSLAMAGPAISLSGTSPCSPPKMTIGLAPLRPLAEERSPNQTPV